MNERLLYALEVFARLLGVGLVGAGVLLAPEWPPIGVLLVAVGLLFVLRPHVAAEGLDLVASLV